MKIYLAGPLFSVADQEWLRGLKHHIQGMEQGGGTSLEVVWPHDLVAGEDTQAWGDQAKQMIFDRCKKHLDDADAVVALLDGAQVDDGTAWEIGYFHARRHPHQRILGIRTDFRNAGDVPGAKVNLMIDCTCDVIVHTVAGLLAELKKIL